MSESLTSLAGGQKTDRTEKDPRLPARALFPRMNLCCRSGLNMTS